MSLRLRLHKRVDMRESLPAIGAAVHQYVVGLRIMIRQQHGLGILGIEGSARTDLHPLQVWSLTKPETFTATHPTTVLMEFTERSSG